MIHKKDIRIDYYKDHLSNGMGPWWSMDIYIGKLHLQWPDSRKTLIEVKKIAKAALGKS